MSAYINTLQPLAPWVGLNSIGILIQPETKTNDPTTTFTTADVGGFLTIDAVGSWLSPVTAGDRIFLRTAIGSGYLPYLGTVTAFDSATQTITTDIAWTSALSAVAYVQVLHSPIIQIYVGHNSTDPYPNELPYQLLAEIQPEWYLPDLPDQTNEGYIAQIVLNGYLRSVFDAVQPVGTNLGINYTLFNKVRLIYDGNVLATANVAYSMLNDTVLSGLAATRGYLTSYENKPVVFSCGETTLTRITNTEIYELIIENGEFDIADSFNNDFNNDFG